MSLLSENIILAKGKWLEDIYSFLETEFTKTPLPSHDHLHHLRVWNNSKFLLQQIVNLNIEIDYNFTEALLIASLFHDSGMLKTYGKDHGLAGKIICYKFLSEYKEKPVRLNDILSAIEKHDDKTYMGSGPLINENKPNLLTALNICDDLDAYGKIGIYRYAEIYLMRGIPLEDLGLKIIANLAGRFRNFISNCSKLPEMIRIHIPRFNEIENFFRHYNLQLRQIEAGKGNPNSGPVAVIKNIYHQTLMHQNDMENICDAILSENSDNYIQHFFNKLKNEIKTQSQEM